MKSKQIGVRVSTETLKKISAATDRKRDPYAPTVTQLVLRGIDLALKELGQRPAAIPPR